MKGVSEGFESKLVRAVKASPSLRTTVPEAVVKTLSLKEGQSVVWRVDKIERDWVAVVSAKPEAKKRSKSD